MKFFRPVLSIIILFIVIGGTYYLVAENKGKSEQLEIALLKNKELKEKLDVVNTDMTVQLTEKETELSELQQQIEDLSETAENENQLDPVTAGNLKQLHYEGSEKDIIEELVLHPELIPYDGILGGTMQLSAEGAEVLSHEWILAPFSDGHTLGYLLVEYKVKDGKLTDWKTIDSYILGDELD